MTRSERFLPSRMYDTERARVVEVFDGRKQEALEEFYWHAPFEDLEMIESVSMDMQGSYIQATREHILDAEGKIAIDRFCIAKRIGDGVNKVRVEGHAELEEMGVGTLEGTRYLWLQNLENMKPRNRLRFEQLRHTTLRVARAWAMKEMARHMWSYKTRSWARRRWKRLIGWMTRSRLGLTGEGRWHSSQAPVGHRQRHRP